MHRSPSRYQRVETVDRHRQQLDLVPIGQRADAVGERRRGIGDPPAEGVKAFGAHLAGIAFRNHEGALPVFAAMDLHQDAARQEAAHAHALVVGLARQAEPEHVERRPEIDHIQPRAPADHRIPSVAAHGQRRAHLQGALGRLGPNAHDPAALLDEVDHLGAHFDVKPRIGAAVLLQEIQQIPLRHEGNEFTARRQMAEIGDVDHLLADLAAERTRRVVRQLEEFIQEAHSLNSSSVEGWTVSPLKSRRKSRCFSKTTTSMPARASRKPSIIPAGPPPVMQHVV